MDDWVTPLRGEQPETAWDAFLARYRRLIFASIHHYTRDHDEVMDIFARVCEALREDDFGRLRAYAAQPTHRSRFSTWLVTVVQHLTIDWFRHRDGRRRLSAAAEALPPLRRQIFEHVFLQHQSHVEAYELIRNTNGGPCLTFRRFLQELRATYLALTDGRPGHLLRDLGGPIVLDEAAEPAVDPPSGTNVPEALEAALGCLSPEDRTAVELYVIEELPAQDIARILRLSTAKAVYNRVYRALAVLRSRLEQAGVERGDL